MEGSVDVHEPQIVTNFCNIGNDEVAGTGHVSRVNGMNRHGVVLFLKPSELGGNHCILFGNNTASCALPGGWPDGHTRGHEALLGAGLTLGHSFLSIHGETTSHDKGHPMANRLPAYNSLTSASDERRITCPIKSGFIPAGHSMTHAHEPSSSHPCFCWYGRRI